MKMVRYKELGRAEVGSPARLIALDHPTKPNNVWITTDIVRHVSESWHKGRGPLISTARTIYLPCDAIELMRARVCGDIWTFDPNFKKHERKAQEKPNLFYDFTHKVWRTRK